MALSLFFNDVMMLSLDKKLKFSSVQDDNNTRELTERFWKLKAFYDAQIPIII